MDFFNDIFHNLALFEFYFLNIIYILLYIDFILSIFFQHSNILTRASHHWCLASNIVLVFYWCLNTSLNTGSLGKFSYIGYNKNKIDLKYFDEEYAAINAVWKVYRIQTIDYSHLFTDTYPLTNWFHQRTLQWRHNDHDSVSNHQPHGCLLNRLFRRRSKKTSKLCVTDLCVGNSRPVTRKMFPFDDVIMIYLQTAAMNILSIRVGLLRYFMWACLWYSSMERTGAPLPTSGSGVPGVIHPPTSTVQPCKYWNG